MNKYGYNYATAGAVTQSGADLRTVKVAAEGLKAGVPVKLVDGAAVALETGDTIADFQGVVVKVHGVFLPDLAPDYRAAIRAGFVQVPVADDLTIKAGEPVYWDAANAVFTNATDGVAIPARFAAAGSEDGCAEIQVFPAL